MEQWNDIRQRILRDQVSIRQIQRETGLHHSTIKKILPSTSPPDFQCPLRAKPKLGSYKARIAAILEADKDEHLPSKQRHTAKRIFERLVRGKSSTKKKLLLEEQAAFLPMPAASFDACHKKVSGQADRMSLVRFLNVTALATQMLEARDNRQLERLHKRLAHHHLLILDEFRLCALFQDRCRIAVRGVQPGLRAPRNRARNNIRNFNKTIPPLGGGKGGNKSLRKSPGKP